MSTQNKLYKCYKEGCYFRQDHTDGPFLTQMEYDDLLKDGVLNCPEGNLNCGLQELESDDYPKPPKAKLNAKLIAAVAAGVLLFGGLVFFLVGGSSDKSETAEVAKVDSAAVAPPVAEEPTTPAEPAEPVVAKYPEPAKTTPAVANSGSEPKVAGGSVPKGTQTLTVGGNSYKGEVLNGKPHGLGTMYYRQSTQISPKDLKKRMAEAGDYLTGEFFEGNVVSGKQYDAEGNVKEVIMIGR
jgi:hypothetical protein